jgi:hypothetical protein
MVTLTPPLVSALNTIVLGCDMRLMNANMTMPAATKESTPASATLPVLFTTSLDPHGTLSRASGSDRPHLRR